MNLNGVRHWYRIAGKKNSKIPVIFVHGGPGGSSYQFEETGGKELESRVSMIYYDQRGSGRSDTPKTSPYSKEQLVEDLEALRVHLKIERAHFLGSSFGGELALEYALKYPQHVASLILEGSTVEDFNRLAKYQISNLKALASEKTRNEIQSLEKTQLNLEKQYFSTWEKVDTATVNKFLFHQPGAAANVRRIWEESGLHPNMDAVRTLLTENPRGEPLLKRIKAIKAPALVLCGLYDQNTGLAMSEDIAKSLQGSRFVVFKNSAHFPHSEEPKEYADLVGAFLDRE